MGIPSARHCFFSSESPKLFAPARLLLFPELPDLAVLRGKREKSKLLGNKRLPLGTNLVVNVRDVLTKILGLQRRPMGSIRLV